MSPRLVIFIALGLVVSCLGVALVLVSELGGVDHLHRELDRQASAALGARIQSSDVSLGWSPLRIRLHHPEVIRAGTGTSPLRAESIELRPGLAPLLVGRLVPVSIEIRGAELRLVREGGRLRLDGSDATDADANEVAGEPNAGPAAALAFEELRIHEAEILLRDAASGREARLPVQDISARVAPASEGGLLIQTRGAIGTQGRFTSDGQLADGRLELLTSLESVDVSPMAELVGNVRELKGRASGRIVFAGEPRHAEKLVADLLLEDAALRVEQMEMLGTVVLHAERAGELATGPGYRFSLDATDAELRFGEAYDKAAGTPAQVTGELRAGENGALEADNLHLKIGGASARK